MRVDGVEVVGGVLDHPASGWHCTTSANTPLLHLGHAAPPADRARLTQYCLGPTLLFAGEF